ncbi:MAG: DNA repair protein RadC [Caulobacteraceae bacterium]|nr:DNA repair protein RadC [Caulobacteraceae bacterium]
MLASRGVVRGGLPLERWRTIVREATEQCERLWMPHLADPVEAREWFRTPAAGPSLLATTRQEGLASLPDLLPNLLRGLPQDRSGERGDARPGELRLAIGPEGGWCAEEEAAALDLRLLHEATLRVGREAVGRRTVISSWSALLAYIKVALANEPREQFRVLFLDKKNQLIADEIQNRGTVDHAPVYPREVMRRALELSSSNVILVHNHPSGDPTPSHADVDMTRQVVEAGRALKIGVHDLVVGRDGVASFKSLGLM